MTNYTVATFHLDSYAVYMDNINNEVAVRIVATIDNQNRSKISVAEGVGIPNSSFHRKLKGTYPFTIEELGRLADELNVHPGTLLPQAFKEPTQQIQELGVAV